MEACKGAASFAEIRECVTPTTVENAFNWRKIETGVLKLSIWAQQKRTCFMSVRSTALRSGDNGISWQTSLHHSIEGQTYVLVLSFWDIYNLLCMPRNDF